MLRAVASYFKTPMSSIISSLSKTGSGNNGQQWQFLSDHKIHCSIPLPDRFWWSSCNTDFNYLFLEHFLHKMIFAQAMDILSLSDSLAPYKYMPCYRHKYILFLVYCYFVFLYLGKLSSLIWTLHSEHCILKTTLEINLVWDELLFLTIFVSSEVVVERENNSFSFEDCFCLLVLEKNSFLSGDLLFLSNGLFNVENGLSV